MADKKEDKKADEAPPDLAVVAKQAKVDHERIIAEAMDAEAATKPTTKVGSFGPFADHPAEFVVVHEAVGPFPAGRVVTYRDFVQHNDPDTKRDVNVTQTVGVVDRLVGLGAIRPRPKGE